MPAVIAPAMPAAVWAVMVCAAVVAGVVAAISYSPARYRRLVVAGSLALGVAAVFALVVPIVDCQECCRILPWWICAV